MGRNERIWAEIAEKAVSAALNGSPAASAYIRQIADSIRREVQQQHPSDRIIGAEWVGGNNYANPGDVHVSLASGSVVKIECKFSHGKSSGTVKNLGQATLSKQIHDSILGYKDFDQPYRQQRYKLVENHISRPLKNAADYQRVLRQLRTSSSSADLEIYEQIPLLTEPGQVRYSVYAADCCNQYLHKVNELVCRTLNIDESGVVASNVVYCIVKQFETKQQSVEFYDYTAMDHKVTHVTSSGQSMIFQNAHGHTVLSWSVHWKNICQGGQTPCFNVFVGNAFKP
jgi:hypothetical protein